MHYADELVDPGELNLPSVTPGKKELAMAEQLISTMTGEWKAEDWKDEYREALTTLIEEKVSAGGKELPAAKAAGRKPTNVVDLVSVLQESLNAHTSKAHGHAAAAKKSKTKKSAHHAHRKAA